MGFLSVDQKLADKAYEELKRRHSALYGGSFSIVWIEAYERMASDLRHQQEAAQARTSGLEIDAEAS
jgi:hypothetical protein